MSDEILLQGVVRDYFDTSDRPLDNKTGPIEAIGDYKAAQHGIISSITGYNLDKFTLATELMVGGARVGMAYTQNDMTGAKYEVGRVISEFAGGAIGVAAASWIPFPGARVGGAAAGSIVGGASL